MPITLGPERHIFSDGLQPFVILTDKGTLLVQAQLRFPPGFIPAEKNAYPGIPGNAVSRDGGKTWTRWYYKTKTDKPFAPTENPAWNVLLTPTQIGPIFEGAALQITRGPVLIQEWVAQGPSDDGWFDAQVWESHDDLDTLDGPFPSRIHLPLAKGGFDDGGRPYSGLTFHRTILEHPSGDLITCVYCWFKEDVTPCPYQPRMLKFRSVLLRSSDRARTWQYVSTIAVDPAIGEEGFDEPAMARVSRGQHAGRLVCVMRTGSNDCPIYQAISDDDGKTWGKPRELDARGVDPDILEMTNGTLAMLVGRRIANDTRKARGYYLWLSKDSGETWSLGAMWNIEPHAATDNTTYYSALREIAPGKLLAVYDVGTWAQPVRYIATREITF